MRIARIQHQLLKIGRGICAAASILGACAATTALAQTAMLDGIAVVTSEHGVIEVTAADAQISVPELHETLNLNGATITTGKGAYIFLALSNGVGIGIREKSNVTFETYTQKPYRASKESVKYEPSESTLLIRLAEGSLAIASNKLSPLSQARVFLPSGELRIHSATCIVQTGTMGSQITACEGTLTYYYPDGKQREFVVEPQSIRISQQSAELGQVTENTMLEHLPEAAAQFAKATQIASKRAFFKAAPEKGDLPIPVLIVAPEHFEQIPARPYEFLDSK